MVFKNSILLLIYFILFLSLDLSTCRGFSFLFFFLMKNVFIKNMRERKKTFRTFLHQSLKFRHQLLFNVGCDLKRMLHIFVGRVRIGLCVFWDWHWVGIRYMYTWRGWIVVLEILLWTIRGLKRRNWIWWHETGFKYRTGQDTVSGVVNNKLIKCRAFVKQEQDQD